MSEIKFRAFIDGEMFNVTRILFAGDVVYVKTASEEHDGHEFQLEPKDLMKYIGIEDIDRVEIYEGDVVNIVEDERNICGYVSKKDGCFGHFEVDSEYYTPFFRLVRANSKLKVIGNIHENPELIGDV